MNNPFARTTALITISISALIVLSLPQIISYCFFCHVPLYSVHRATLSIASIGRTPKHRFLKRPPVYFRQFGLSFPLRTLSSLVQVHPKLIRIRRFTGDVLRPVTGRSRSFFRTVAEATDCYRGARPNALFKLFVQHPHLSIPVLRDLFPRPMLRICMAGC